ncbi:dihydropteroate synthase [Candidatus Enterococcus lemimoniae]|uniref:Dihydropteroate synthase n=1 Tax=Candidatus Enterococcus lemimoniae TaxID=1834167 RepID=A0ABZ2T9M8_9ENTE|nr:dihydropteroate synthase [Enterococcus sp. 12C11_DIV0727]OTO70041.1 dihydropteroate synthase [Enterococcus sp. 12C11_DIV0727]
MIKEGYFTKKEPQIMGILNVTPDSFSDGGQFNELAKAMAHCEEMLAANVDIIDIGGQSTRPNYQEISAKEEKERILPIIRAVRKKTDKPISIDTYFPEVADAALAAGANVINDIKGLDTNGMIEIAQKYPDCGVIIMHSRPRRTELSVADDIQQFYQEKIELCQKSEIDSMRICFDPGIGFGKSQEENIEILKHPEAFRYQDYPLLYGVSRKRTIAALTNEADPTERDFGSIAASLFAVNKGIEIVRVHHVKGMRDTLNVWQTLSSK